jgi:hypothetical protein
MHYRVFLSVAVQQAAIDNVVDDCTNGSEAITNHTSYDIFAMHVFLCMFSYACSPMHVSLCYIIHILLLYASKVLFELA